MRFPRRISLLAISLFLVVITLYTFLSPHPNPGLTITVSTQGPLFDSTFFSPGTPSPSGNHSLTIVTGHLPGEDISWLTTYPWPPHITLSIHPIVPNSTHGHEAYIYLSYILTHYPDFPSDVTLFIHPHAISWHNNILHLTSTLTTIQRLSLSHVIRQGYFNTRCHLHPGCPSWLTIDQPWYKWDLKHKPEEPFLTTSQFRSLHNFPPSSPLPEFISQPCCAQFAVSTQRILSRPKANYQHYLDWLSTTNLDDATSGRLMEYSWQYIFTGLFEWCPSQHQCYCDGYGICFEGREEGLQRWLDILKTEEQVDEKVYALWKKGKGQTEKYKTLKEESDKIGAVLEDMKNEALKRGGDLKLRAAECGREWAEGDRI